ncbi:MAG: hypothetical protein ACRBFS_00970 [Aureispira sp.]
MNLIEAYECALKGAMDRHKKLLIRFGRASDSKKGEYQNQLEELRESILFLEGELEQVKKSQNTPKSPSQAKVYCYVFTDTLDNLEKKYDEKERIDWLRKRYDKTAVQAWQPFVTKYDPVTIGDILKICQNKYPFEIIYWKSQAKNYVQLDESFSQTFAILDWLALKPSNRRGFLRYDSKWAKYVAPDCEVTYELFTKDIEVNQSYFVTTPIVQHDLKEINMNLSGNSIKQIKAIVYYFLEELSKDIYNKSMEESAIRAMNFDLNAQN